MNLFPKKNPLSTIQVKTIIGIICLKGIIIKVNFAEQYLKVYKFMGLDYSS